MMNNMTFYGKSLLFMGAHPDDIELGCGAFIAGMVGKADIFCYTFSDNQKNPDLLNLVTEHANSMRALGLKENQFELGTFETRRFPDARQEILEKMIALRKKYQPKIVFVHTAQDLHQDHQIVTQEAMRAFRGTTVLGFDVLRSSYGFFPHFLTEVSEEDLNTKIAALAEYKTYQGRYYFSPEIIRATAIRHGALAERPFAEGFDIIRIVANFSE
ncbi:MAG TPA: PIG-L family deacetylase [Anaerolineaceae bacterium]|jgi:LmbE family N-acetylglucosaminyl deacetylase|nr:PIG-L family deacetylase [Anaerolineaceae bacterium]HQC64012.1 PIG-L family deacetylase [Anaerolineaceae bacterium]HQL92234.1 PIG-L family deacetylase [Anaerolineaceae bacterium]